MTARTKPRYGWLAGWRLHPHGWMRLYRVNPWDFLGSIRWGPQRDPATGAWQ